MRIHILPDDGNTEEIRVVLDAARVPLVSGLTIREIILQESDGIDTLFAMMSAEQVHMLLECSSELLSEPPTMVMFAPGFVYSGQWTTLSNVVHAEDWSELSKKFAKSGARAHHLDEIPKMFDQSKGAVHRPSLRPLVDSDSHGDSGDLEVGSDDYISD